MVQTSIYINLETIIRFLVQTFYFTGAVIYLIEQLTEKNYIIFKGAMKIKT